MKQKKIKRNNKVKYDIKVHLCDLGEGKYRLRYWHRQRKVYIKDFGSKLFHATTFDQALMRRDAEQADPRLVHYIQRNNTDTNFVSFFEDIIATKRNQGTRTYYSQSLAKFKEFAGSEILFTAITKETIENFKSFLLRNVKQNTANGYFASFAHVIRSAEEKGYLKHMFFKRIPQSQVEKS